MSKNIKAIAASSVFVFIFTGLILNNFFPEIPGGVTTEHSTLVFLLNILFITITSTLVAWFASKSYLLAGTNSLILLAAGSFSFGLSGFMAGWFVGIFQHPNMAITMFSMGVLFSAIFHFAGAIFAFERIRISSNLDRKHRVIVTLIGVVGGMALITLLTWRNAFPQFFLAGFGPTLVRQSVLGLAVILFASASLIFWRMYYQSKSDFIFWYFLSLGMIATGLGCVLFGRNMNEPVVWTGRIAQYLGGIYFLIAVSEAWRNAKVHKISLERAMANFFSQPIEFYKSLVETVQDAIISCDREGRVLIWNAAAVKIFGFDENQAVGKYISELILFEEDRQEFSEELRNLDKKGKSMISESIRDMRMKRRDGNEVLTGVSASIRKNYEDSIITLIIRDITSRKITERALAEAHYRTTNILERIKDAFIALDSEWNITYVNPAAELILTRGTNNLMGKNFWEVWPYSGDLVYREKFDEAMHKQTDIYFQNYNKAHDSWLDFHIYPLKEGLNIFFHDITDRKKISQERARMAAIVEFSNDAIISKDLQGIITSWNPACEKMYGFAAAEVIGKPISIIFPEERMHEFEEILGNLRKGIRIHDYETTRKRKDGERLFISLSVSPIKDENGITIGASTIERDITGHKHTEELIRKLHRAVDQSPSSIIITDSSGIIEYANPKYCELSGYNQEEIIGNTPKILKSGQTPSEVYKDLWKTILSGRAWQGEMLNKKKNGELYWEYISIAPVKDEDEQITHFVEVKEDITERKETEAALRLSEERLRLITDSLPAFIAYIDEQERYQFNNIEYSKYYGYKLSELRGKHIREVIGENSYQKIKPYIDQVLGGKEVKFETRITLPQADEKWQFVEVNYVPRWGNGKVIGFYSLSTDITERNRAEKEREKLLQKIAESEKQYRIMGETVPYGVWLSDPQGGARYLSPSFLELMGLSMKEAQGFGWTKKLPPEHIKKMRAQWLECVRNSKDWEYEYTFNNHDGDIHTILCKGRPVRDENGNIVSWVGLNLDITDRKKMEEDLRRIKVELELRVKERTASLIKTNEILKREINDRMQAEEQLKIYTTALEQSNQDLEDFAFMASHDLQEPLRKIQSFGDRLRSKYATALNEEAVDYLQRMEKAAGRMRQFIKDLLEYSRIATRAQPHTKTDLNKILEEVHSNLESLIQRNQGQVCWENLPAIYAEPRQMVQVFQNLVGNALKFHRDQVSPVVNIHAEFSEEKNNGSENDRQKLLRVYVKDNGIGFDEKYLDRIFAPFQRLHSRQKYEGTGIGLAICRKIIERHEGTLTATSTPGKGTTFIVSLPQKNKS